MDPEYSKFRWGNLMLSWVVRRWREALILMQTGLTLGGCETPKRRFCTSGECFAKDAAVLDAAFGAVADKPILPLRDASTMDADLSSPSPSGNQASQGESSHSKVDSGSSEAGDPDQTPTTRASDGGRASDVMDAEALDDCRAKSTGELTAPLPRSPASGEYTGSVHARAQGTLRPELRWSEVEPRCGAPVYELQIDDSCVPGEILDCGFASPDVEAKTSSTNFRPELDLSVQTTPPVGALHTWRVRACDQLGCSAWSAHRYINVGRIREDINGDGFGDIFLAVQVPASGWFFDSLVVFPGALNLAELAPEAELSDEGNRFLMPRFVGDINGDGYGDLMMNRERDSYSVYTNAALGSKDWSEIEFEPLPSIDVDNLVHVRESGDLDGDGFADVVLNWYQRGAGGFMVVAGGERFPGPVLKSGNAYGSCAGIGDVDGDALVDLALVSHTSSESNSAFSNNGISIWLSGDSSEVPSVRLSAQIDGNAAGVWVRAIGDLDGNGLDDWVIANQMSGGEYVHSVFFGSSRGVPVEWHWMTDMQYGALGTVRLGEPRSAAVVFYPLSSSGGLVRSLPFSDPLPDAPDVTLRHQIHRQAYLTDLNGDGRDELVTGRPEFDELGPWAYWYSTTTAEAVGHPLARPEGTRQIEIAE